MEKKSNIDRSLIRSMVEDFWRSFLVTSTVKPESAKDSIHRFEERLQAMASIMPLEQSNEFLKIASEEREIIAKENERNPEQLKMRLGLKINREVQSYPIPAQYQRQSLPELAVRTAVRATVWKSIGAAFRLFR